MNNANTINIYYLVFIAERDATINVLNHENVSLKFTIKNLEIIINKLAGEIITVDPKHTTMQNIRIRMCCIIEAMLYKKKNLKSCCSRLKSNK